jgi:hypothetical protein
MNNVDDPERHDDDNAMNIVSPEGSVDVDVDDDDDDSCSNSKDDSAVEESAETKSLQDEQAPSAAESSVSLQLRELSYQERLEASNAAFDALLNDSDDEEIFNDDDEDDLGVLSLGSSKRGSSVASSTVPEVGSAVRTATSNTSTSEDRPLSHIDTKPRDDDEEDDARDNSSSSHMEKSQDSGNSSSSSSNSDDEDSAEDYTDDEDEGADGYKPGGYHPVKVGEVYYQRCVRDACMCVCLRARFYIATHSSLHF